MDVNNNTYTFSFAIIMVIIVAAILSTASIQLKPYQDVNIELEKKQNILSSVGVNILRDSANIVYPKYIKEELVLNYNGDILEGSAFNLDLSFELKKDKSSQLLPLFISEVDNEIKYIVPLRGKGLWGPIWGFIALEKDLNTVYGAVFDHKAETPGLGAEINRDFFQDPFKGKNIFNEEGIFKSIVVKKGGADIKDKYAVDGISGGTITSDGVTDMLSERLKMYLPYFERLKSEIRIKDSILKIDSLVINDTILKL
tara:strand:+ start:2220 stop:2987 length:768 start_codon:yes stop_codon:yes gene_type:complete